jgi:hypothetical protein
MDYFYDERKKDFSINDRNIIVKIEEPGKELDRLREIIKR